MLTDNVYAWSARAGTLLWALIIVLALIGLTMHRDFYAGKPRRDFFCFYTNLSNLLVLVYFALIMPRLYASSSLRTLAAHADFAVMMSIMLTFSVFHVLLFPAMRARIHSMPRTEGFYLVCADNLMIHYLVPLLTFAFWLFCSPGKSALGLPDALLWTAFPLLYVAVMLFRARSGRIIEDTGTPYPYPFLDVTALGATRVCYICLRLLSLCLFVSIGVVSAVRLVSFLF